MPVPKKPGKRLLRFVVVGVFVYCALLGLLMWFEESLIFFPARYPQGEWDPPELAFEDVSIEAADGTRLHAWYVPHEEPRAFVLYAHGNAGNLSHRWPMLRVLHDDLNVATLIFDYRGYGRSEGRPHEAGVLDDARAARDWLAQHEGLRPNQIVLLGESLGCGVCVQLAAEQGARGLVLQNAFTSMPDVAANHYPVVPVRYLMRTRLPAIDLIDRYHGPLLQSHAGNDSVIPIELGRRLFAAAHEPKQFLVLDGQDHNDLLTSDYWQTLDRFLDDLD